MPYSGAPRGGSSADLPPGAFISFIQNHDQIGNRAFGERLNALAPPEMIRALASVYLIAPQTPMLFMGEEWGAMQPFPYFCDFLGPAGRRHPRRKARGILAASGIRRSDPRRHDPRSAGEIDVPFAKLDWSQIDPDHLGFYRAALMSAP